ncbi:MAG: copper oxidase, partial [Pedobacter sp.]
MKKLIVYILLMGLYGFASAHDGHTISLQQKQQPVVYTCPMHPEIQSKTPGNCSKCGMKLVIQKKKSVPAKKAVSSKKTQPAKKEGMGKMNMSPQKAAVETPSSGETYTCPMHAEIHASKPGNCPKCGMKLVKETQKTAPTKHEGMDMPMKEDAKKSDSMEGMKEMQMGDDNATMENIKKAKVQLGPIKTITSSTLPRTVRYDLYVADTTVTYGKKSKRAIAVNGQIPMPTLTFTEGDTALIYVHNNLDEETSLHWHGLFLPNKMDGVPFLTQMPIMPHTTYVYKFPIVQHGTHWYHSHSMLQE